MKYCNGCNKETKEVVWDDSFDYAGTHCTHGKAGTHHDSHKASECCDDDTNDGIFIMCKCGHTMEVSQYADLPFISCPKCHRIGNWINEADYDGEQYLKDKYNPYLEI